MPKIHCKIRGVASKNELKPSYFLHFFFINSFFNIFSPMCTKPVDNLWIVWKTYANAGKIRDKLWITLWIFHLYLSEAVYFVLQA